jgi:hypothetical protein
MTVAVRNTAVGAAARHASDPLDPIRLTVRALATRPGIPPIRGISPDLDVDDSPGWVAATELFSGTALDDFLDTAKQRWRATPHAAAALAWKCYSYWLSLPAVLGYAAVRRVPLMRPDAVSWQWSPNEPFLFVGLRQPEVAVLPSDPLARTASSAGRIRVVADEAALLAELRASLIDGHLQPLLDNIRDGVRVSSRALWGSLASGVAHGLLRAGDVLPGSTVETVDQVLEALNVRDLVDLIPDQDGGDAGGGIKVQRRTCCLRFTLPEPRICSGCCIR